jgi:hypothetical protein
MENTTNKNQGEFSNAISSGGPASNDSPMSNNGINELKSKFSHIKGWGVDYNPEDEPNYPMKKYTGDDHNRLNYERPAQQQVDMEILRSTERPTISAVFGTAVPPTGLSGMIRRLAYKFSESEYGHWLGLLLADRVNVVEGLVQDLGRAHIPNIFAERGGKAEWKHNRKGAVKKIAVAAILTTALIVLVNRKNKNRN